MQEWMTEAFRQAPGLAFMSLVVFWFLKYNRALAKSFEESQGRTAAAIERASTECHNVTREGHAVQQKTATAIGKAMSVQEQTLRAIENLNTTAAALLVATETLRQNKG